MSNCINVQGCFYYFFLNLCISGIKIIIHDASLTTFFFCIIVCNILFRGFHRSDGVHEFIFGQGHEPIVDA